VAKSLPVINVSLFFYWTAILSQDCTY